MLSANARAPVNEVCQPRRKFLRIESLRQIFNDVRLIEPLYEVQWFRRLTLCFSRSWDNLRAALALHFAYYNLCWIHGSLRIKPAMDAGIADHVWTLHELMA